MKFIRKGLEDIVILLSALASPFVMVNKAGASEGWINIFYDIDSPYTDSDCAFTHYSKAKEGLDEYDDIYFPMFNPSGIASKITSVVEGKELDADQRPENSTSSASFSYTVISEGGGEIPPINNPYLNVSTNGFDDEDVFITVEGVEYDAKSVGSIPLTSITGSGSVSFVPRGTEPNEPNQPAVVAAPGKLRIDNVHNRLGTTTYEFMLRDGATEGIDSQDQEYTLFAGIPPPFVVSKFGDKYFKTVAKGTNSKTPTYLEQDFYSEVGFARLGAGDTNTLVFSFPDANLTFGDRVLTFQEYKPSATDSNVPDPNAETYPVYLVRNLIADGNGLGVVVLPDLERKVYAGTWHNFVLRTDSNSVPLALADFNNDGRVDVNDSNELEAAIGYIGNSKYDIASADANDPNKLYIGIRPDGKVDVNDRKAFSQLMAQDEKRRGYNKASTAMMEQRVREAVKDTYDELYETVGK